VLGADGVKVIGERVRRVTDGQLAVRHLIFAASERPPTLSGLPCAFGVKVIGERVWPLADGQPAVRHLIAAASD
jgi:hypothetical protein